MVQALQIRERELALALSESRELASVTAESRRRVEAAHADLLATLETVPAALMIFNADGSVRLRNRAATEVFGIEPQNPRAAPELLGPIQAHRQGRHANSAGAMDLGARAARRDRPGTRSSRFIIPTAASSRFSPAARRCATSSVTSPARSSPSRTSRACAKSIA